MIVTKKKVRSLLESLRIRWKDVNDEIVRRRLSGLNTIELDARADDLLFMMNALEEMLK